MKRKNNKHIAIILIALTICAILFAVFNQSNLVSAQIKEPETAPDLFTSSITNFPEQSGEEPTVFRERSTNVNFTVLSDLVLPEQAVRSNTEVNNRVQLNLFDDVQQIAIIERVQPNLYGSFSWLGHLEDVPFSSVILVTQDNVMTGHISYPGGIFEIQNMSGNLHRIKEINQAAFPSEEYQDYTSSPLVSDNSIQSPMDEDGSYIDVMVIYTDDARIEAKGTIQVKQTIQVAIDETNESYWQSGITQRVRLVSSSEISYAESGDANIDLARIRDGTSPFNSVEEIRNNYAADIVVLIVKNLDACGIAYTMFGLDDFQSSNAYSVVALDCATGYYSFGHELGHIMGAWHDWYVQDTKTPRTYSHGYVRDDQNWRTIMAYNDECDCTNEVSPCPAYDFRNTPGAPSCSRLMFWSNPSITYVPPEITPAPTPVPMGIPDGTYSLCVLGVSYPNLLDCDADNRKILNLTNVTVSNFRQTKFRSTVYVDSNASNFGSGTALDPYQSADAGVGLVLPDGTVYFAPGTYDSVLHISRPMILRSNGSGSATIGQ